MCHISCNQCNWTNFFSIILLNVLLAVSGSYHEYTWWTRKLYGKIIAVAWTLSVIFFWITERQWLWLHWKWKSCQQNQTTFPLSSFRPPAFLRVVLGPFYTSKLFISIAATVWMPAAGDVPLWNTSSSLLKAPCGPSSTLLWPNDFLKSGTSLKLISVLLFPSTPGTKWLVFTPIGRMKKGIAC